MKKYILIFSLIVISFTVAHIVLAAQCTGPGVIMENEYCGQSTWSSIWWVGQSGANVGVGASCPCANWGCHLVQSYSCIDWGDGSLMQCTGPGSYGGTAQGGSHTFWASATYTISNICDFEVYKGPDPGQGGIVQKRRQVSWGYFPVTVPTPTVQFAERHLECISNTCSLLDAPGVDSCAPQGSVCDLPPPPPPSPAGSPPVPTITATTASGTRFISTGKAEGTISGTAADDVQVTKVQIAIRKVVGATPPNQCGAASANFDWNGSAWVHACGALNTTIAGTNKNKTWVYTSTPLLADMTVGTTYRIFVNATDNDGNTNAWNVYRNVVFTAPTPTPSPGGGPSASNVQMAAPNYCVVGPGTVVSWDFTAAPESTPVPTPTPTPIPGTLTVYPSSGNPGSVSVDCPLGYNGVATTGTYAAAHNAASATVVDHGGPGVGTGAGTVRVENTWVGGSERFFITRYLANFDTSALPDDATLVSATFGVYGSGSSQNANSDAVSLVANSGVSATACALGDYATFSTTKFAADKGIAGWTAAGWNIFTLNSTGLAAINLSGVTKLGLRLGRDVANTAPTGLNYALGVSADRPTNKPYLTIQYTIPAPTPTPTPTPSGSSGTQKAYQVQVDSAPYDFTAPVIDSGTVTSTTQLYSSALSFNTLYRARVKVMDQSDAWGDWSDTSAVFATPAHACPQVDFSIDPEQPPAGQEAQFTDATIFDVGSTNQNWLWDFGDGAGASTLQNPSYTYTAEGGHTVTLQVSDDSCTCSATNDLNVQHRLPAWKEVQPK